MINNSKLKTQNSKLGFTMIELLAVAVVIIAVSSIVSAILFSSLRGVSRTSVTDAVRQNGNSAISEISREIRFAKLFKGVSPDGTTYSIDSETDDIDCTMYRPTPTPTPTPGRGYTHLKIVSLENETIIFSCEDNSPSIYQEIRSFDESTIISPKSSIFDTGTVKMDLSSCYFTCSQSVITDPPTIGVHFTLSDTKGDTTFFEQKSSSEFQTSVTFRNLNK